MKKLYNFLMESAGGSYIYTINLKEPFFDIEDKATGMNKDEYVDAICSIKSKGNEDFKKFVGLCFDAWITEYNQEPQDIPFRFNASGGTKLARVYKKLLGGEKQTIGGIKIELGNGSVGKNLKIKTENQETATCLVWNAMVSDAHKEGFNITNTEQVKDIVGSIGIEFPKSWILSFQKQCQAIYNFIEKNTNNSPINYRAVRYDADDANTKVGKKYAEFVKLYIKKCEPDIVNIPKDNYDPSDIILYTEGAETVLDKLIAFANSTDDSTEINNKYKELAFDTRIIIGTSLKKITGTSGRAEFFNIGEGSEVAVVNSIKVDSHSETSTKITATGRFNFSGISDPESPETPIEESTIILELRSFGKYTGMDCKSDKGPSLGKVPVRKWTSLLKVNSAQKSNLKLSCKKFAELGEKGESGNATVLKQIQELIQWGIKSGPWCLPFVLVH